MRRRKWVPTFNDWLRIARWGDWKPSHWYPDYWWIVPESPEVN